MTAQRCPTPEPFDWFNMRIVACASVPIETVVTPEEVHDWATKQVRQCGHARDFVQHCRVCRDVIAVISALDSGASGVRAIPRGVPVRQ